MAQFTQETAQKWLETRKGRMLETNSRGRFGVEFYSPFSPQFARKVEAHFENVAVSTSTNCVPLGGKCVSNADWVRMKTTVIYFD